MIYLCLQPDLTFTSGTSKNKKKNRKVTSWETVLILWHLSLSNPFYKTLNCIEYSNHIRNMIFLILQMMEVWYKTAATLHESSANKSTFENRERFGKVSHCFRYIGQQTRKSVMKLTLNNLEVFKWDVKVDHSQYKSCSQCIRFSF